MMLKSLFRVFMDQGHRSKREFLTKLEIFRGLKKQDITHLLQILQEKTYVKDEVMFREGDIGRALFIVSTGTVLLTRKDGDKEVPLANINPGEIFGEMALLEEMPRTATATAAEKTHVFMLYKTRLDSLLYDYPNIGVTIVHYLARTLSARLRATMSASSPK